jgi:hypothetical protein
LRMGCLSGSFSRATRAAEALSRGRGGGQLRPAARKENLLLQFLV